MDLKNAFGSDIARAKETGEYMAFERAENESCAYPCSLSNSEAQCYLNRYADLKNAFAVTSLGQKITGEYMAFERAEIRLVRKE